MSAGYAVARRDHVMATTATITTNHGDVRINLFPDQAPKTVRNFTGHEEGTQEWTDPKVQATSTV